MACTTEITLHVIARPYLGGTCDHSETDINMTQPTRGVLSMKPVVKKDRCHSGLLRIVIYRYAAIVIRGQFFLFHSACPSDTGNNQQYAHNKENLLHTGLQNNQYVLAFNLKHYYIKY